MKSSELTPGERIHLERWRLGESQKDAADRHGVSLYMIRLWEADKESPPRVSIGHVTPPEECYVKRRRAGMTVEELASDLDVSRWWIRQMEAGRGNYDRLVAYWRARGAPWRPRRQETVAAT